jgi:endoglucanase
MAPILNEIGMSDIRGFATNVSNFNSTDSETTYANALSAKTGDSHYIIDTSRNGNGGTSDWCNPTGRALGHVPTVIDNGTAQDADLWVKQPGESDGSCNGGPTAGTWWDAGALALATNAGWS